MGCIHSVKDDNINRAEVKKSNVVVIPIDNSNMLQKNARSVFDELKNSKVNVKFNSVFVPLTEQTEREMLDKELAVVDEKTVSFELYDFRLAYIESVYDGDTYTIIALHHGAPTKFKVRLYNVNTPETKGSEKAFGIKVRDYVRGKMEKKIVRIHVLSNTYIGKRRISEKYGRLLANITIDDEDLGRHLVSIGYAKVYDGGFKEGFDAEL